MLYQALTAARCIRLHLTIGLRLETGYGERAGDIAASLALHFGCGRDFPRAVRYHRQAATNAARLCGYREAITHLGQGLKMLEHLPETEDRNKQESVLQQALGLSLAATKGYASTEVQHAYARAKQLCDQTDESPESWFVLHGLWAFYVLRGRLDAAHKLALQLHRQAQAKLRAAVTISELWRRQKKIRAAYHLLSGIYLRFSEGLDTPDLELAGALREQLRRSCDSAVTRTVTSDAVTSQR